MTSLCLRERLRSTGAGRTINEEPNIHIFVFCLINFLSNRFFAACEHENMNIPILIIVLPQGIVITKTIWFVLF